MLKPSLIVTAVFFGAVFLTTGMTDLNIGGLENLAYTKSHRGPHCANGHPRYLETYKCLNGFKEIGGKGYGILLEQVFDEDCLQKLATNDAR